MKYLLCTPPRHQTSSDFWNRMMHLSEEAGMRCCGVFSKYLIVNCSAIAGCEHSTISPQCQRQPWTICHNWTKSCNPVLWTRHIETSRGFYPKPHQLREHSWLGLHFRIPFHYMQWGNLLIGKPTKFIWMDCCVLGLAWHCQTVLWPEAQCLSAQEIGCDLCHHNHK